MGLTAYLVWMIGMAIATIAILTLGTLAAADLLHAPSSRGRARRRAASSEATSEDGREPSERGAAQADRDGHDLVGALAPLGSSLYAGAHLTSHDGTAEGSGRLNPRELRSE